ncbi:MAG: molybdopterin molybdotransferase MoeA [Solirubrobacteraceae bacterium]
MPRELIELEAARGLVLEHSPALGAEDVALGDALGRTLAENLTSTEAVPGFDNSAMDGFAVRASDTSGATAASPTLMRVVDESRAGHPARRVVRAGEAIAISTGAVLPEGADAVVRIEEVHETGTGIELRAPVDPGRDVRTAGEDIRVGDVALRAGTGVGPFELGVLASVGRATVPCVNRPTLRILSTGDELVDPHEPLRAGSVRNTNAYTVPALARLTGAKVAAVGHVGDDAAATRAAVAETLDCHIAVICGGVSVGAHDHVRPALSAAGARELFWGVALRPGKPTWFGTFPGRAGERETLVFGLPGNPVSAIVTFLLFVAPAIRSLCGASPGSERVGAMLDQDYRKRPGRTHAVRCRLRPREDGWHARLTGPQGSHILTSMRGAEGLAMIPAASDGIAAGEQVEVELLPRMF